MARAGAVDVSKMSDDELIDGYLSAKEIVYRDTKVAQTAAGKAMLSADPHRRAAIAARAIDRYRTCRWDPLGTDDRRLRQIVSEVLRAKSGKKDAMTAQDLVPVIRAAARIGRDHRQFEDFPKKSVVGAVEKLAERCPLSGELRDALEAWRTAASPRSLTAAEEVELARASAIAMAEDSPWAQASRAFEKMEHFKRVTTPLKPQRELLDRLDKLLGARGRMTGDGGGSADAEPVIPPTDAVGAAVERDRAKKGPAVGAAWHALLSHALALNATAPSKKWLADAAERVASLPPGTFAKCIDAWFGQAGRPAPVDRPGEYGHAMEATLLNDRSADLLKGLAWAICAAQRVDLVPKLGAVAEACYRKVPNHGPRNVRVANAAVAALAAMGRPEAAGQLAILRTRVKHPSTRAAVEKSMKTLSGRTGLSVDELAEIGVPTFNIDLDEAINDPSKLAKDAARMLAAQKVRIERLFLSPMRSWPLATWRERYLDHPLVGLLARRLIWRVDDALVVWRDGRLLDVNDRAVKAKEKSEVRLWHPTMSKPREVLAWRQWLEGHEVVQPFKQAHREVYLLTDAERQTGGYSNRFAAHILRQHQLAALAQQRGWAYRLQGNFDSFNSPTLALPEHRLIAEFWVEPLEEGISDRGIYLYVTSDQVRFGPRLEEVPPIVFSEVMRDVDLFVGVASIANDPTWQPGDSRGAYRDYWEHFSFGALSETASTRRQVLERLVPRLKIADRCTLGERFLTVRGDLRTYKIHLGSGNILMQPNDQYLCIVPDRRRDRAAGHSASSVRLPFEGDDTLSVILSKAFLLADDAKIKDPTIVSQIRR